MKTTQRAGRSIRATVLPSIHRVYCLLLLGLSIIGPTALRAADIVWNNAAGGSFQNGGNWVGGSPPGINDRGAFSLGGAYTVTLTADVFNQGGMVAHQGDVTLDLGGFTYDTRPDGQAFIGDVAGDVAKVTISNGVAHYRYTNVGFHPGAMGTLNLDGPQAKLGTDLFVVGGDGDGASTISGGAELLIEANNQDRIFVGVGANSHGNLIVTGAGSKITGTSATILTVGGVYHSDLNGQGAMSVLAGGRVDVGSVVVADSPSSTGEVQIAGPGSELNVTGLLLAGDGGTGKMSVQDGARLTTGQVAYVGFDGANSQMTVNGLNTTWDAAKQIQVGVFDTASLTISGGAVVTSHKSNSVSGSSGIVGNAVFAGDIGNGSVTISGAGSRWDQDGAMNVGFGGIGDLTVEDGGVLNSEDGVLARLAGAMGGATVTGDGSGWNASRSFYVGGSPTAAGGDGTLAVRNQGLVSIADTLKLWATGTVDMTGGGRVNIGSGSPSAASDTLRVGTGGTLAGTGTIIGDVLVDGGSVSPGSSPGALHVNGDVIQLAGGLLVMEIGGLVPGSDYDQLVVSGDLSLLGNVNVAFSNGFLPQVGDHFTLFDVGGTFSGATLSFVNAPAAFSYQSQFAGGEFVVTVTAVPEPSTLALACFGSLGVLLLATRRAAVGRSAGGHPAYRTSARQTRCRRTTGR